MVDGRDTATVLTVLTRIAAARPLSPGVFADPKRTRLVGMTNGVEIVIELEPSKYEWSRPAQGGVFPVRQATRVLIAEQPVPEVEFCGYIGHDKVLVMMDGTRSVLERYSFDDAYMFE